LRQSMGIAGGRAGAEGRTDLAGPEQSGSLIASITASPLILSVLAVFFVSRAVLAGVSNLSEDEAYYWLWSTHLAAGYYDHPPMIAYWIRAGTTLFGETAFGVRFAGLIAAALGSYLLYLTSFCLFRDRGGALMAAFWLNVTLIFNAAALIATPDTPLAFFTVCTLLAVAKLIETGNGRWWYAGGAALGLAFMSKYTAVLLVPCLFLWMAVSQEGRRWLFRPEPYAAAVLALILTAPVFYWNYTHDWVSFAKQAAHGVKDKPASAVLSIAELLGGQAGLVSPLVFGFCLAGSVLAFRKGLNRSDPRWLLLGAMSAPLLAFFIMHAAEQKIQANWPGLLYPAAVLAAVHCFRVTSEKGAEWRWLGEGFRAAPWVGVLFTVVAFLQLGFGFFPIEAKKDPASRLRGWAKFGAETVALARGANAGAILTGRYATTGELAFYGSPLIPVIQMSERVRYANLPEPPETKFKDGPSLLVLRRGSDPSQATQFFESAEPLTTLLRDAGPGSRDYYDIYLLKGYRGGLFSRQ
jgi:4-amino-4-deoxy-L-arabinose transferase-like glycosyltransferase